VVLATARAGCSCKLLVESSGGVGDADHALVSVSIDQASGERSHLPSGEARGRSGCLCELASAL